ncbi:MAG: ABC transporter ATP-binding protein [Victivallales bacterium]|nr:ABC transporter ATP-binding protein [Victivallales bacterium]
MSTAESLPLLEVRGLTVDIDTEDGVLRAVDLVSFSIAAGESFGLVGESGCGKSVTSMSLARLIPSPPCRIVSGEVFFCGRDLLKMPIEELRQIRGKEIGVIFQEPMTALSPLVRVGDQLAEVVHLHEKVEHKEALERARLWLDKVGIPDTKRCLSAYPFELSGGMRKRVMIAMALILQPKLIIADEPTTALDVTIQAQILDLMREVKGPEAALLLITHDMGVIWEMCQRMAVMYASRIVEAGPVKELFAKPLHPYTQGLLRSIPSMNLGAGRLPHIPGQVPSLLHLPTGCAFAERCDKATAACRENVPPLIDRAGHSVACVNTIASTP